MPDPQLATILARLDRLEAKIDRLLADRGGEASDAGEVSASSLLSECGRRGFRVTGDQRVTPAAAAELVGLARQTLSNLRTTGEGPVACPSPAFGSRISYRFDALADFLNNREKSDCELP